MENTSHTESVNNHTGHHDHVNHNHSHNDKSNRTAMGVLAYLGPLVIISYLVAKDDPFVKFHIRQGLVLLSLEIITYLLMWVFWPLQIVWWLVRLIILILAILGIINVVQGKEKELPVVGELGRHFKI